MTNSAFVTDTNSTWEIDGSHSDVSFSVKHLMISKVRGHFGSFRGSIETGPTLEDLEVKAVLVAASITTNDENRDGHLRSADFFDTANYPEISFTSSKVEKANKENEFLVHGELEIRGIKRPITLEVEFGGVATDGYGQTKSAVSATTVINRTEFGLTWNSALETGGVLVGENINIVIDLQATLKQEDTIG